MVGKLAAAVGASLTLLVAACSSVPLPPGGKPDYALARDWVSRPATPSKAVDVFWVYPTVYEGKPVLAPILSPQMRRGAELSLHEQASVFADSANLFAPLYRQANLTIVSMPPAERARYLAVGIEDVEAAFAYYLKHLNNGRPFILAGHSQGADVLTHLIRKELGRPDLRKRMVAAYIIGWSITKQDLKTYPFMKLCHSAAETGCIVTYNSVAAGHQADAPTIQPGAIPVNPLSWSTGGALAPASENLGAVIFDAQGHRQTLAHFASAQNRDGGLVVAPKDPGILTDLPFGPGVYHAYDYNLFYMNLKANAARRIGAFLTDGASSR